jgi:hypothetical protein
MPGRGNKKQHPIQFLHASALGSIQCVHVVFLRVKKRDIFFFFWWKEHQEQEEEGKI